MKILRYIILLLAVVVYAGGCSRQLLRELYNAGLVAEEYRYGDLYRLANLPQFKAASQPCPAGVPARSPRQPVQLLILGDSFTEPGRIGPQDFPVERYDYIHWNENRSVYLDTTKTSVLMLQTVERHFREHFREPVDNLRIVYRPTETESADESIPPTHWKTVVQDIERWISPPGTEERFENLLFSSDFFLWFKELKADLTYRWFGRVNPAVSVSPDGQHLLYALDTDADTISSSFRPLPGDELNRLVDSVNEVAMRYRALGFDKVVLSIIPNKTSIVAPGMGNYNRLIERVQRHPRLTVPVVDVYSPMKASREPVYEVSDSHWNCLGRTIWLREAQRQILFIETGYAAR